ncbi:MAG: antirestriction protein [Oleiphilaceae bacterium]|jgi:antirestriction protein
MTTSPQIYVADLAAYNNGTLHGVWIDAAQSMHVIQHEIDEMLNNSPEADGEEYAIHDHEGFDGCSIHEYDSIDRVYEIACFIATFPEFGADLLAQFSSDIEEAQRHAEQNYCGHYDSVADFAEELTESTTTIPKHVAFYIDYDKMVRDMEMGGDIFTIGSPSAGWHIFWG